MRVILLLSLLFACGAVGATDYRVEMILFSHKDATEVFKENWRSSGRFPSMAGAIGLSEGAPHGFIRLPKENLRLDDLKSKLAQSAKYRLISHLVWQQPGLDRQSARPVAISAGKNYRDEFPERMQPGWAEDENGLSVQVPAPPRLWQVDGTIKVVQSRFLHVYTDLLFRMPVTHSVDGGEQQALFDFAMKEHRRLRSGEVHYLDHPLMGILVRIDPV